MQVTAVLVSTTLIMTMPITNTCKGAFAMDASHQEHALHVIERRHSQRLKVYEFLLKTFINTVTQNRRLLKYIRTFINLLINGP